MFCCCTEKSPAFLFCFSHRCPNPDQMIAAMGTALTDIECVNVSIGTVNRPKQPGRTQFYSSCVLVVVYCFNFYSYLKPTIMSCCFVSDHTEQAWPLVLSVVTSVVLMAFSILIIINVTLKIRKKKTQRQETIKETKKAEITQTPIIRTPTGNYYCTS